MIEIPESHVQRAFDLLRSGDHATARAAYEFAEKQLKVTLARAALQANGKTVGEREASALTSPEYERTLTAFKHIAEAYYLARDKREAASAIIDAWRTQQSDLRASGRVA
ncbi:MAG: hypothetical protein WAW13_00595 [Minisyncoccia bacterium]